MTYVVHRAGYPTHDGLVQTCARCGELIDDMRGAMVELNPDGSHPGPPPTWDTDGFVGIQGPSRWYIAPEALTRQDRLMLCNVTLQCTIDDWPPTR